ncbi:MAG TPA: hypothetical protein VGP46_08050 [Acidimicrobiales bacterium]|jgi:hypothetical protein|nr:hypothetical protein [Acidimicrobiales bacterium]
MRFSGEQTGIDTEVDLGAGLVGANGQTSEASADNDLLYLEAGCRQCRCGSRHESIDSRNLESEEIEILGRSVDLSSHDESATAGEGKSSRRGSVITVIAEALACPAPPEGSDWVAQGFD